MEMMINDQKWQDEITRLFRSIIKRDLGLEISVLYYNGNVHFFKYLDSKPELEMHLEALRDYLLKVYNLETEGSVTCMNDDRILRYNLSRYKFEMHAPMLPDTFELVFGLLKMKGASC